MYKQNMKLFIYIVLISIFIGSISGGVVGFWAGSIGSDINYFSNLQPLLQEVEMEINKQMELNKIISTSQESAVVKVVENVSPAVVSIIITKDLPIIQNYDNDPGINDFFKQFFGEDFFDMQQPQNNQGRTIKREIGGGTGFIVSEDGYILTNRHVVSDLQADYTILMNDGKKLPAQIVECDQTIDLAVLKINGNGYKFLELGDSEGLKVGQLVIAIGNALGEFRNTVSTGVISGLSRSIRASGGNIRVERLFGVIQTDASINPGNSGGPLLDLSGQVVGIITAMAQGAENIGFTIPINDVRKSYELIKNASLNENRDLK